MPYTINFLKELLNDLINIHQNSDKSHLLPIEGIEITKKDDGTFDVKFAKTPFVNWTSGLNDLTINCTLDENQKVSDIRYDANVLNENGSERGTSSVNQLSSQCFNVIQDYINGRGEYLSDCKYLDRPRNGEIIRISGVLYATKTKGRKLISIKNIESQKEYETEELPVTVLSDIYRHFEAKAESLGELTIELKEQLESNLIQRKKLKDQQDIPVDLLKDHVDVNQTYLIETDIGTLVINYHNQLLGFVKHEDEGYKFTPTSEIYDYYSIKKLTSSIKNEQAKLSYSLKEQNNEEDEAKRSYDEVVEEPKQDNFTNQKKNFDDALTGRLWLGAGSAVVGVLGTITKSPLVAIAGMVTSLVTLAFGLADYGKVVDIKHDNNNEKAGQKGFFDNLLRGVNAVLGLANKSSKEPAA